MLTIVNHGRYIRNCISCSDKVGSRLGFILNSNLTFKQKGNQTARYILKRISSIRRYPTGDATKQPVTSCVLPRLDYCNSLMGTPNSVIQPMQKVQNTAARLCSQSTMPSKLHTSPTATPLAPSFSINKIQNCLHGLQRHHRFRSLLSVFLNYCTFKPVLT